MAIVELKCFNNVILSITIILLYIIFPSPSAVDPGLIVVEIKRTCITFTVHFALQSFSEFLACLYLDGLHTLQLTDRLIQFRFG